MTPSRNREKNINQKTQWKLDNGQHCPYGNMKYCMFSNLHNRTYYTWECVRNRASFIVWWFNEILYGSWPFLLTKLTHSPLFWTQFDHAQHNIWVILTFKPTFDFDLEVWYSSSAQSLCYFLKHISFQHSYFYFELYSSISSFLTFSSKTSKSEYEIFRWVVLWIKLGGRYKLIKFSGFFSS